MLGKIYECLLGRKGMARVSLSKFHVTAVGDHSVSIQAVSVAAGVADSSFSQGFFLLGFALSVPCPSRTVLGISLMPGTG